MQVTVLIRRGAPFVSKTGAAGEQQGHGTSESDIPLFAFDYLIIAREGLLVRHEADATEDGIVAKIIVAKDSKSKAIFAHAVR